MECTYFNGKINPLFLDQSTTTKPPTTVLTTKATTAPPPTTKPITTKPTIATPVTTIPTTTPTPFGKYWLHQRKSKDKEVYSIMNVMKT